VQRRFFGLRAAVPADHAQLCDRNIELVAVLVFQDQEFALALLEIHFLQTHVPADAMLLVHHRLADLELGEIAQHPFDRAALLRGAAAAAHHAGVELGLGDHRPAFGG
jgi:hypothetical protein